MKPSRQDIPIEWLLPREYVFTDESMVVGTVLGSCIAVCLWRPRPLTAAICHCVLPTRVPMRPTDGTGTYVDETLAHLLQQMQQAGGSRNVTARLIGGAAMKLQNGGDRSWETVGVANVAAARMVLSAARVPVVWEDVGGSEGRRVRFHTDTGEVTVQSTAPASALQVRKWRTG